MLRRSLAFLFTIATALVLVSCGDEQNPPCEVNGVSTAIADNHPSRFHTLEIPAIDVMAAVEKVYDIQGNNTGHGHTVTVLAEEFTSIDSGMIVTITSSDTGAVGMDHTHVVTLDCSR